MKKKKKGRRDPSELLTLADAAEEYYNFRRQFGIDHPRISADSLAHYANQGKLDARKYGKMWLVTRAELLRFAKDNLGPGPGGVPRKVLGVRPKRKAVRR